MMEKGSYLEIDGNGDSGDVGERWMSKCCDRVCLLFYFSILFLLFYR